MRACGGACASCFWFPPAALALGVLSGCRSRRLALQRLRSRRRAAHAARGVRPLGRRERRRLRALARDPRGALAGPARRRLDDTNLGKYLFEVRDRATNRLLYSRGFASIYGEWETTDEAKQLRRAFSESLRFPEPAGPVQVLIEKRDRQQAFREVWSVMVDPRAASVDRAAPPRGSGVGRAGERPAARQGGPAAAGRRLHRRRDGEVARRRDAA